MIGPGFAAAALGPAIMRGVVIVLLIGAVIGAGAFWLLGLFL